MAPFHGQGSMRQGYSPFEEAVYFLALGPLDWESSAFTTRQAAENHGDE